jgi:hypothetical protein
MSCIHTYLPYLRFQCKTLQYILLSNDLRLPNPRVSCFWVTCVISAQQLRVARHFSMDTRRWYKVFEEEETLSTRDEVATDPRGVLRRRRFGQRWLRQRNSLLKRNAQPSRWTPLSIPSNRLHASAGTTIPGASRYTYLVIMFVPP